VPPALPQQSDTGKGKWGIRASDLFVADEGRVATVDLVLALALKSSSELRAVLVLVSWSALGGLWLMLAPSSSDGMPVTVLMLVLV